jgi:hypothetical protein
VCFYGWKNVNLFVNFQLSIYDNGATFGQSLLDLKMSKSSTRKRVILAGILIGGKYAFSRWKNVARLISHHEDSVLVRNRRIQIVSFARFVKKPIKLKYYSSHAIW